VVKTRQDPQAEIDRAELNRIQQRFVTLSKSRLDNVIASYNYSQADAVKLLPLLFHVNHPLLPGYVDKTTPCGIPNYTPSELELKIAKTVCRSFKFETRAYLKFEIAALYLMGSAGTLGHSVQSDLDFWLCLSEMPEPTQFKKLAKKSQLISQWMAKKGIELNCYLVHKDDFSRQQVLTSADDALHKRKHSAENSGTTQHYLLLDEFYRTAVWLAGRQLLWWLIEPGQDYSNQAKRLLQHKHIEPGDWLDLGEVKNIPADEYFSAALWQQYKAISSPYKSSVKLLILEIYARYVTKTGLISSQFKQLIYDDEKDHLKLDPYLMLLNYAEQFLLSQPQRLEFLRRAFYLKSGVKVQLNKSSKRWRYQQMLSLVKTWGWQQERLDYLNSRQQWQVNTVQKERIEIVRELTHSYHFLSSFARSENVLSETNQQDLITIGRKLHAAFERKPNKLEFVNQGVSSNMTESALTLVEQVRVLTDEQNNKRSRWQLYLDSVAKEQLKIHQPVFLGDSLFELIAWSTVNHLVNRRCNYQVYAEQASIEHRFIKQMSKHLFDLIANDNKPQQNFKQAATTVTLAIFVNTEKNPLIDDKADNVYAVDQSKDLYSWGDGKLNLLPELHVFTENSWGESFTKRYTGNTAWIDFFIEYQAQLVTINDLKQFYYFLANAEGCQQRVTTLFLQWQRLTKLSLKEMSVCYCYLMAVADSFLKISFSQGNILYNLYSSQSALLHSLAEPNKQLVKFNLDPNIKLPESVDRVIKKGPTDQLHCYLVQISNNLFDMVINQTDGKIFYCQHQQSHSLAKLLNQYQLFFDSLTTGASFDGPLVTQSQYSFLELTQNKKISRFRALKPQDWKVAEQFTKVQAIATYNSDRQICFDLYTDNQAFCYSDYGELVYRKLVQSLLKSRKHHARYPIFITHLDLSQLNQNTSLFAHLNFKRQVEHQLKRVMQQFLRRK
jgi:adenylate cyclase, class 1